ncbi:MAG TPA: PQQ-binding-like beta-propeller repeat protein [Gammaproteobacteria bacterium]
MSTMRMASSAFVFLLFGAAPCFDVASQPAFTVRPLVQAGAPFHGVHGLRFGENGLLYATSVIGQSIFTVAVDDGTIEPVVGPRQGMADDIAIAPDGTLVWTAIEDGVVYAMPPGGPVRRLWEDRKGVNAVGFSPDGERLFVTLVFYDDALYELDLEGDAAPRLILDDIGGLNAFEVGADGMIYGPLYFEGRVVRIDPDGGAMTTISDAFDTPSALKLAAQERAYVVDERRLKRVDLGSGATSVVAELPSGGDNLAVRADGRIFVSLAAENAIVEVDAESGDVRYVVGPTALTSPAGIAVDSRGGRDTLYIGDAIGGLRIVDGESGAVEDTPLELFQPAHVSIRGDRLLVVSEVFGEIQRVDRRTFEVLDEWTGFVVPGDAVEMPEGDVIVAETGTGRLLRVFGPEPTDRRIIATGLARPRGLAWSDGGAVFVTESALGRLLRINVETGAAVLVATGLEQPEGVAVMPDGAVIVVEAGARRLKRFDTSGGAGTVAARDLPLHVADGPSLYRAVGVGSAAIYVASDVDNTIYRLTPRSAPSPGG